MNSLKKVLPIVALLAIAVVMTRCEEKFGEDPLPPNRPQVKTDASTLAIKVGEQRTVYVAVSAAGTIKDIAATTNIGTITTTDELGVGTSTGSMKISFVAPDEVGTGKITVTVTDESSQTGIAEVAIDISEQSLEIAGGEMEGIWGPDRVIVVHGDVTIPKGKSLTIKEGTTVIIDGEGSGFIVEGNFYSLGTAEKPNLFTVPEADRKKENIFAGLWGGVIATGNTMEMVVLHSRFEFAGAPAKASTPIVNSGELEEGDPRFALYFNNPDGKFIMQNSTIAYTKHDGVRINQGQLLITNNTYILTGGSGGDALGVKSGSVGDVAYNIFISAATNGITWSNSDERLPQNNVNVYNNTVIGCGWRETTTAPGGSFNVESNGRGRVYNNMVVNCRYGIRFAKAPDAPDIDNSSTGYNLYYGNNDESVEGFYPETGSIVKGDYDTGHDVSGTKGENDPKFVDYDVTAFDADAAKDPESVDFIDDFDLRLQSGSPALNAGSTALTPNFTKHTVNSVEYAVPGPSSFIGAKGN